MRNLAHLTFLSILLLLLWGCHPTAHLNEGQFLLNKNIIKSDNPDFKDDLKSLIKQKPNRKILGIARFHLGVNNLFHEEDSTNWYKRFKLWVKKTVGEPPVILDTNQTLKSSRQLSLYMHNKGFFNAEVTDTTIYKRKKANVYYTIKGYAPYTIRNITRESKDKTIENILNGEKSNSLIKSGDNYDVDILQAERERLALDLKNKGYYYFSKEYIYYKIDSALNKHQVDIHMGVRVQNESSKTVREENHHSYTINEVYVQTDYNPKRVENRPTDTLIVNDAHFVSYTKILAFKPEVIALKNFIKKGEPFNATKLENTYRGLSDLGVFKFTNIRFEEVSDSNAHRLNCYIQLTPAAKESFTIETEGTHNGGNLGVAGNLTFRNKNTFKGAELFEFKLKGALEAQKTFLTGSTTAISLFNTIRVGPELSLNFQRFLLPFKIKNLRQSLNPKTSIPLSYNYEKRPGYNREVTNIALSYSWRENLHKTHSITLIEINKVNVDKSVDFAKALAKLGDPLISNSYQTHLTTASRYTFLYTNQVINVKSNFSFFRGNAEFSGNILRGINNLMKSPLDANNSYKIAGINYSQYARFEADFRRYNVINQYNSFVYRAYAGIGIAYKNSKSLPVEKLFFAGGASDIRGWQARTLGPGAYNNTTNTLDQNGDLKLEANLEYRFYIFKILEGAAFVDAGNIWALNDSSRPGSEFNQKTFIDEVAIAGGFGARLNFTFFIFRVDGGVKLKDPSKNSSERYVLKQTKLNDINWNIGIGYPF